MMPHWFDLKYFLCVCETKNISRASEVLGISQPSLSLAIKRLETVAQVPLFIRTKNGVDLTRHGVAFKERSEELLSLWESISHDIKKESLEVSGRYIFGAHISVALNQLTPVLKTLMNKYPKLALSVTHGLSRIITEQVIGFGIDFALVVNPTPHPDLVIKEVCQDTVSFFVSEDGYDEKTLIYDPNLLQAQSLLKACKDQGLNFARSITSSSLEFIGKLAQQGSGVGLLPKKVAEQFLAPSLILLDKDSPQYHDRHCLIFRADAHKTKSARLLAVDLKELLILYNNSSSILLP